MTVYVGEEIGEPGEMATEREKQRRVAEGGGQHMMELRPPEGRGPKRVVDGTTNGYTGM